MRRREAACLAGLLLGALGLRLWGIEHGLPFAYNSDEDAHYVPRAIGLLGHGWNPQYFVNPPGLTYVLKAVFAVAYGGASGAGDAVARDPGNPILLGRVVSAVLSTVAVGLTFAAARRMFDTGTGLLAAGLLAVAFLPVFYGHLALNDGPVMAPVALSLLGTAGVLTGGGRGRHALAGLGAGLAAAVKYTGGIALIAWLAAALALRTGRRPAPLAIGLAAAGAGFLVLNPYALLDFSAFTDSLSFQATKAGGSESAKVGLDGGGPSYYAGVSTWALGLVPAVAALAGAVLLVARDRARAVALLVPVALFMVYMGTQERHFARWLMPILPLLALLAGHAGATAARALARRVPRLAPVAPVLAAVALLAQGAWASVQSDRRLSREDSRNAAREWMVANVPEGSRIVLEPAVPATWLWDPGAAPSDGTAVGARWSREVIRGPDGEGVRLEDYVKVLRPELVDDFRAAGACWVVLGSTMYGRAFVSPDDTPDAVAYYRRLERESDLVHRSTPYKAGADPPGFDFDTSFLYSDDAYERPGAEIRVLRLRRCTPKEPGADA